MMDKLSRDWITEGAIDFEYKKYVLLAYLQHCHGYFEMNALYPPLAELLEHYNNLLNLNKEIEKFRGRLGRNLTGLDSEKAELKFEYLPEENAYFSTVTDIVEYALPSMRETILEGRNIYEKVEQHIELQPVGIMPVYRDEGYLLVQPTGEEEVSVFNYKLSVITGFGDQFRALECTYLFSEKRTLANTYENIKISLIRNFQDLPNPATYLCRSSQHVPMQETLLPVTRRLLLRHLLAS